MANGFKVDTAAGAPGVQPWSRGEIYPLVISRVERYAPVSPNNPYKEGTMSSSIFEALYRVPETVYWDVLNADDDMSGFASYDDALAAAKGWLAAQAAAEPAWVYEIFRSDICDWMRIADYQVASYRAAGFRIRTVEAY